MSASIIAVCAGLAGVVVGAVLTRRNARKAHADVLLADALNDLVAALARVGQATERSGSAEQARDAERARALYASAVSRVVLHGSSELVEALRAFQLEPTTGTIDGRRRLIAAMQQARVELGRPRVAEDAAAVLLFGSDGPIS